MYNNISKNIYCYCYWFYCYRQCRSLLHGVAFQINYIGLPNLTQLHLKWTFIPLWTGLCRKYAKAVLPQESAICVYSQTNATSKIQRNCVCQRVFTHQRTDFGTTSRTLCSTKETFFNFKRVLKINLLNWSLFEGFHSNLRSDKFDFEKLKHTFFLTTNTVKLS